MIEHNTLTELVTDHYAIPAQFAQQHFLLDGAGALFWPKHDMLVFSDLHFEKGSFLTQFAHPLPRFDTQETLARMHLAIERYDPTSVLCLGDSFHDGNALQRMDDAHIKRLNEMIQQTRDWIWILGNHDPLIPDIIKGRRETEIQMEEICFAHEPCTDTLLSGQLMLFGHFHPKASAVIARHKVVGSCFVNADSFFIMPAFGKYTGGLSVKDDAIQSLLNGAAPKLYLTYSKKIYCV